MYIKVDFKKETLLSLKNLTKYLNKVLAGFISQVKPEAGLGCHPFHITLVGKVQKELKEEEITPFLIKWEERLDDIKIGFTKNIWITSTGKVQLLVKSNSLKALGNEIHANIPKASSYCRSKNLHITLGVCKLRMKKLRVPLDIFNLDGSVSISHFGYDY